MSDVKSEISAKETQTVFMQSTTQSVHKEDFARVQRVTSLG